MRDHQNMVFGTAVRLLGGNSSDAKDIAQAVFLKAYENFENVSIHPNAGGWLRTVTTNLCLNHMKRYRSRWHFFSELQGEDRGDFTDKLTDHDQPALMPHQSERQEALETALEKLPESQRVPLVLFHFEEMSYDEIARQLGVTVGKIKIDIHRGRIALRKAMEIKQTETSYMQDRT